MAAHLSNWRLDSGEPLMAGRGNAKCLKRFGGPEGIRTLDLFHAMEARSQLRHRPTRELTPPSYRSKADSNQMRLALNPLL